MDSYVEDCKAILSQIKQQDKDMRLKRRWLMGISLNKTEGKRMRRLRPPLDKVVPESLLREEDLYYENIKNFVERGFGLDNSSERHSMQDNLLLFDLQDDLNYHVSLLNGMTNKELCGLAEILTNGSVKFDKTKWKMKEIIKEYLPKVLKNHTGTCPAKIKQLRHMIGNPQNFQENSVASHTMSDSFSSAAFKILDELENLPNHALRAMHRRLECVEGYMPEMKPVKCLRRTLLTKLVREGCRQILSELCEGDEPPEPLVKALAVADLMLQLTQNRPSPVEFQKFSPETQALQKDIMKAIVKAKDKLNHQDLWDVQHLLDPSSEVSQKGLAPAVRKVLSEYLLECSEMDTVPEHLLKALAIINKPSVHVKKGSKRSSGKSDTKVEMGEEVECLLNVSAQTKQIVWDLLPQYEVDQDFADAYMEDLEKDEIDIYGVYGEKVSSKSSHSCDLDGPTESIGQNEPNDYGYVSSSKADVFSSPILHKGIISSKFESVHDSEVDSKDLCSSPYLESKVFENASSVDGGGLPFGSIGRLRPMHLYSFVSDNNKVSYKSGIEQQKPITDTIKGPKLETPDFSCGEINFMDDKSFISRNKFLSVQAACDETSMVTYSLVGNLLYEFTRLDGITLSPDNTSYLRSESSIHQHSEVAKDSHTLDEDDPDAILFQVLDELIPLFPESRKQKLKELMGTPIRKKRKS